MPLPLLIPALGGAGVVLAAGLIPDSAITDGLTVPFSGVNHEAWLGYVKACMNPATRVTANSRIGVFEFTIRRLCDLGVMHSLEGQSEKGHPGVKWNAKWTPPRNLQSFLADRLGQYRLFSQSTEDYANELDLVRAIGAPVDGAEASLSGLLGVAHRSGLKGLRTWLASPKERAEFKRTTAIFQHTNGLF
jgi:hypothetical protein